MITTPKQILPVNYLQLGNDYYFLLNKPNKIENINLPKGEYIIHISNKKYESAYIKKLQILSLYELVPQIFIIGENYIIYKFLRKYMILENYKNHKYFDFIDQKRSILNTIIKNLTKWHTIGYGHNKISLQNILIKSDTEILFINPAKTNSLTIDKEQIEKLKNML